jgi:hypothetical protein
MKRQNASLVALCEALAEVPGLTVTTSSAGGGQAPLLVFFTVVDSRWLYVVGRAIDRNYGGFGFRCELATSDLPDRPVSYLLTTEAGGLRGPELRGRPAYLAAKHLARRIRWLLSPEAKSIRDHFHLPV